MPGWDTAFSEPGVIYADRGFTVSNDGTSADEWATARSFLSRDTGKWYAEIVWTATSDGDTPVIGLERSVDSAGYPGESATSWALWGDGTTYTGGVNTPSAFTVGDGEIARIAVDLGAGKVWLGNADGWAGDGDPAAGTDETYSFSTSTGFYIVCAPHKGSTDRGTANFGGTSFAIGAPTGFAAWDPSLPPPEGASITHVRDTGGNVHRIAYADGTVRTFNNGQAYRAEIVRLLVPKVPEAVVEAPAPMVPRQLPVFELRPEMLALITQLELEAEQLRADALVAEAEAFYRLQMEFENAKTLIMLAALA